MNLSPSPPSSISSSSSSRLSFISATSSHSTFSDYSVPPQTSSKTHAFFASPFPTRPPSPTQSKTHSFFNSIPQSTIDVSTPTVSNDINIHIIDAGNEPTPRPNHLEPALPWLHSKIQLQLSPSGRDPTPKPDPTEPNSDEPHPGYIISSPSFSGLATTSPPHSGSPSTPTPSSPHQSQSTSTTTLRLIHPLGHGAFSSVWLADDLSPVPLALRSRRSLRDLRRQASLTSSGGVTPKPRVPSLSLSLSRAGSLRTLRKRVSGTRPISGARERAGVYLDERHGQMGTGTTGRVQGLVSARHREIDLPSSLSRSSSASSTSSSLSLNRKLSLSISIESPPADGASRSTSRGGRGRSAKVRLVAVKMTLRGGASVEFGCEERTRVAFVREVEVLRHISHPNITPLLTHLSTPTHHVLVLPYLPGGDLLALVNSDTAWSHLRESVLRRIWSEICKAAGWMHGVGLVHRDIKLENILLTTPIFAALAQTPKSDSNSNAVSPPTLDDLPQAPAPLIKLTDFGLSRFVDIRSEEEKARDREARRRTKMRRLKARQGVSASDGESSADEDKHSDNTRQQEEEEEEEEYEGPLLSTRCGSEAYAAPELVMGGRAAGKGVYDARETDAWACGVVLYALVCRRLPFGEGVGVEPGVGQGIKGEGAARGGSGVGVARRQWLMRIAKGEYEWPCFDDGGKGEGGELIGKRLVHSEGAQRIVEMLLARNPKKRARVADLWEDEWMGGGGDEVKEEMHVNAEGEYDFSDSSLGLVCGDGEEEEEGGEEEEETEMEMEMEELEKEEEEEDGWIVDQDGIDSIARREVV